MVNIGIKTIIHELESKNTRKKYYKKGKKLPFFYDKVLILCYHCYNEVVSYDETRTKI